jgi:hypothetical protein
VLQTATSDVEKRAAATLLQSTLSSAALGNGATLATLLAVPLLATRAKSLGVQVARDLAREFANALSTGALTRDTGALSSADAVWMLGNTIALSAASVSGDASNATIAHLLTTLDALVTCALPGVDAVNSSTSSTASAIEDDGSDDSETRDELGDNADDADDDDDGSDDVRSAASAQGGGTAAVPVKRRRRATAATIASVPRALSPFLVKQLAQHNALVELAMARAAAPDVSADVVRFALSAAALSEAMTRLSSLVGDSTATRVETLEVRVSRDTTLLRALWRALMAHDELTAFANTGVRECVRRQPLYDVLSSLQC